MGTWTSSPHPISDVREWKNDGKLEIQPDFQRRAVWSETAKISLIDTILQNIPMPKIFVAQKMQDDRTYRVVIDGQQRITAILDFIDNKFCLKEPYEGVYSGKYFRELDQDARNRFLLYNLDFNIISGYSDTEIREMYHRVNKYTVALNKQELRRADFPGKFLTAAEELAGLPFFEDAKIFTTANRRRLGDVEYVSELLAVLLEGPQDKKTTLDNFYTRYKSWPADSYNSTIEKFEMVLDEISNIFSSDCNISSTRFRQKADFYSLFAAIDTIKQDGRLLVEDTLPALREDLMILNDVIEPNSPGQFGEYAVKCVSDANSVSSRKWRKNFLSKILMGAYGEAGVSEERLKFLMELMTCWNPGTSSMSNFVCAICNDHIDEESANPVWVVPKSSVFLSSLTQVHDHCLEGKEGEFLRASSDTDHGYC